jgi:hypothetical protein
MIFQLGTYNRQLACEAVGLLRCGVLAFQDHSALFAAFSSNYEIEVKARHSGHISLGAPIVSMSDSDEFLCLLADSLGLIFRRELLPSLEVVVPAPPLRGPLVPNGNSDGDQRPWYRKLWQVKRLAISDNRT